MTNFCNIPWHEILHILLHTISLSHDVQFLLPMFLNVAYKHLYMTC